MRDDDGEYDGFGEMVADGVSCSEGDDVALSDVVVLVVGVFDVEIDRVAERLL